MLHIASMDTGSGTPAVWNIVVVCMCLARAVLEHGACLGCGCVQLFVVVCCHLRLLLCMAAAAACCFLYWCLVLADLELIMTNHRN